MCVCVCPPLPWPYLWTDFETKGTYGLPMTQGWLQKYKILEFRKIEKKIFFWKISLLECLFIPKGRAWAAGGGPLASSSKADLAYKG